MKYQLMKKIYDMDNKVCTFKCEKLSIFIAFVLPPMEKGTDFLVFQSDLKKKKKKQKKKKKTMYHLRILDLKTSLTFQLEKHWRHLCHATPIEKD